MTDSQKFFAKVFVVMVAAFGGWAITLPNWNAALTPLAFGGLLVILGSQLGGILGITTPNASRAVDIALLPGVHTKDDVEQIQKSTEPGTIPTPAAVADILNKPAPTKP